MRVGVLTGGGDCPGLNAVIRAVVRKGVQEYGHEFVGFRDGWRGPLEGRSVRLDIPAVRGILPRGGTILGSSRTNPLKEEDGVRRIKDTLARQEIGALVTIGGEDTLGVAARLSGEYGVPVSACRRRSTTTCPPPTTRSASTPPSASPRRPSTGCTPPPSPICGSWWSR